MDYNTNYILKFKHIKSPFKICFYVRVKKNLFIMYLLNKVIRIT